MFRLLARARTTILYATMRHYHTIIVHRRGTCINELTTQCSGIGMNTLLVTTSDCNGYCYHTIIGIATCAQITNRGCVLLDINVLGLFSFAGFRTYLLRRTLDFIGKFTSGV